MKCIFRDMQKNPSQTRNKRMLLIDNVIDKFFKA